MSASGSTSLSSLGALVRRDRGPRSPLRTLDDIRNQVAYEVAMRTIAKAKIHDGIRTGVCLTFSQSDDELFLRNVAVVIEENLLLQDHLFIIGTTGANATTQPSSPVDAVYLAWDWREESAPVQTINTLIICGSSFAHVDRAGLLTGTKFFGRVTNATDVMQGRQYIMNILDLGASPYDEATLWDVVRKSVRISCDPKKAPLGSKSIEQMLQEARVNLVRLTPREAYDELRGSQSSGGNGVDGSDTPAFLVDIRPTAQREQEGSIAGSLIIERNVLEWRFDPRCEARLAIADRYDLRVIVFCQEGYTSSLAARALQQLGLYNATDIVGGFKAWRQAGLPIDEPIRASGHMQPSLV
ncbi:hypothetical protein AX15_005930 [Amanita polypyramis BW_CC]|nr:hypothetical protein AX15_005930 [Amanita polypyramis BW_CC]